MRRPRLFWRIYATYLVIVVLCTAAVGFYAVRSVRDFYLDHTERELQARAALVREQVLPAIDGGHAAAARGARAAARRGVGDAHHAHRGGPARGRAEARCWPTRTPTPRRWRTTPPVRSSSRPCWGRPGRAIRYSETLRQDMMYVAVPVTEDGRLTTVMRTAVPLTRVNDALGVPVREHRRQRDRRGRDRRDHRLLRVAAHQRPDARDQGRGRAPGGRGLHAQALRAAGRGVRVGGREHQPDG